MQLEVGMQTENIWQLLLQRCLAMTTGLLLERPVQEREPLQYVESLMLHSGTLPVPFLILHSHLSEVQISKN